MWPLLLLLLWRTSGTSSCTQNRSSPFSPDASPMLYRPLGQSGLRVSAISYGAWLTVSETGAVNLEKHVEILKAAIRSGINFIDNAEVYGAFPGESESIMGQALHQLLELGEVLRSDLVISTKIFDGGNGVNDRGLSRKHIVEGMQSALHRMRLSYVDLVFCHRPDVTTPMEETVRAMNHIVDRGWAFYWGTSEWSAEQITHAHGVAMRLGLQGPLMEQPLYNLFHRDRVEREYASLYRTHGLGLTVYSPLAEGILAGRYSNGVPADSRAALVGRKESLAKQDKQIAAAFGLRSIAEEMNCSLPQLSLAWVLHNQHVSTAIIGASRPSQIVDNVGAIACLPRFAADTVQKIENEVSGVGAAAEMRYDISATMAARKLVSAGRV
ncbi:Probable voltage-gated potassium channel subunit beta (K(+) channel subunit beta) [Durusdinium trenchii]